MKTATITWITFTNCGTYLQAYALQQVLEKLDVQNDIIDDRRFVYSTPTKAKLSLLYYKLFSLPGSAFRNYRRFAKKYLHINSKFKDPEELNAQYDAFLCGSDQIWSVYSKVRPFFYLDFAQKKKIAYAPSTGADNCSEEYRRAVKPLIERFYAISVREETSAKMLSSFVDKKIDTVLDPTFLLTEEEWSKIEIPVKDENYIFCYFLTPNEWYLNYVQSYANRKNKKLFIAFNNKNYKKIGDKRITAAPQEFVSYIHNADMVFTDSYHASIFSILFRKEFVTFQRFDESSPKNQNARIENLFEKLNISDHFIKKNNLEVVDKLPIPQYIHVYEILSREKEHSLDYLKKALFE